MWWESKGKLCGVNYLDLQICVCAHFADFEEIITCNSGFSEWMHSVDKCMWVYESL